VRENVRFLGGHLTRWVSDTFPDRACALAIDVKKIYMDEWTGRIDELASRQICDFLAASIAPVLAAFLKRLPRRSARGGRARASGVVR
jgi:hypothetical protein